MSVSQQVNSSLPWEEPVPWFDVTSVGNVIFFTGDISQQSAQALKVALQRAIDAGEDEVVLYIHSLGGDSFAGYSIHDHLASMPIPIAAVADGYVRSAGMVAFLGAPNRYSLPHASFRIHQGKYSFDDGEERFAIAAQELRNWAEDEEDAARLYVDSLYRTGDPRLDRWREETVLSLIPRERDLSPADAEELGLILGEWPPKSDAP